LTCLPGACQCAARGLGCRHATSPAPCRASFVWIALPGATVWSGVWQWRAAAGRQPGPGRRRGRRSGFLYARCRLRQGSHQREGQGLGPSGFRCDGASAWAAAARPRTGAARCRPASTLHGASGAGIHQPGPVPGFVRLDCSARCHGVVRRVAMACGCWAAAMTGPPVEAAQRLPLRAAGLGRARTRGKASALHGASGAGMSPARPRAGLRPSELLCQVPRCGQACGDGVRLLGDSHDRAAGGGGAAASSTRAAGEGKQAVCHAISRGNACGATGPAGPIARNQEKVQC
jgi:hypothetical protein